MNVLSTNCANCGSPLVLPLSDAAMRAPCHACGTDIWVEAFPALLRATPQGRPGETLIVEDESSCFYHPAKKAVVHCQECGRFLCALCDIEMNGRRLCSACIETGVRKGRLARLQKEHVHYDDIALALATLPLLLFWATLITAPIALYIAIRYWNRPLSAAPRRRWRFVLAIVVAGLELGGWAVGGLTLMGVLFSS
jgi:ribosomal protein S27E